MSLRAPGHPDPAQHTGARPAPGARRALVLAVVLGVLTPLLGGAPAVAADPPSVTSIVRAAGAPATVGQGATLRYVVTFDSPVSGVDPADFTLSSAGSAGGSIATASGSGTTWQVTVDTLRGTGVLRLDLNPSGTGITGGGGEAVQGGFSAGQAYTVDADVPSAPRITSPATTTNPRPTVAGTAEPRATVTLSAGGATYITSASSADGAWAVDLAVAVPSSGSLALDTSGPNPVGVTATDAVGNVSSPGTQTLVIGDPHPAVTAVSVPADGVYPVGAVLAFLVRTQEPVDVDTAAGTPTLDLVVGGTVARAPYVSGSGTSALVFRTSVQAGWQDANGITVAGLTTNGGTLRTAAGADLVTTLSAVDATAGVLVDGVAPAAPDAALVRDTGASSTDGVTADGRVRVQGLEQGGAWEWSVTGGATWSPGADDALVLPEGGHPAGAVQVRQTDSAGNSGPAWVSDRAVVVDLSAPARPELDATPVRTDAGLDAEVGVLAAADPSGPVVFALVAGAGDSDNDRFVVQGDRLLLRDPAGAGAGPRTVRVAAVDVAGNRSETALDVVVAEAAPVQSVTVQPSDRLDVVPGATASFAVEVAEPGLVATVRWQVASSAGAPDATTRWRDVPGADALVLAVPVVVGADAWYRAVVTGTGGAETVSEPARLSAWDVRVHAGADHEDLAARFPDAADLAGAATGLDLAALPGTVTLSLPWAAADSAVTAFVYSDPAYLGTFAAAGGRVTLTGVALGAGEHYVVLVGVDTGVVRVLRYDTAQAVPAPAPGPGAGGVGVAAPGPGTDLAGRATRDGAADADRLARTGTEPVAAATCAALLLLVGALLLGTAARRRRDAHGLSRR